MASNRTQTAGLAILARGVSRGVLLYAVPHRWGTVKESIWPLLLTSPPLRSGFVISHLPDGNGGESPAKKSPIFGLEIKVTKSWTLKDPS